MVVKPKIPEKFNIVNAILISAFVGQLAVFGAWGQATKSDREEIQKIKKSYVDYIAVQQLIESNIRLARILSTVPNSPDYHLAMREWEEFQVRTLKSINPTRGISN